LATFKQQKTLGKIRKRLKRKTRHFWMCRYDFVGKTWRQNSSEYSAAAQTACSRETTNVTFTQ